VRWIGFELGRREDEKREGGEGQYSRQTIRKVAKGNDMMADEDVQELWGGGEEERRGER
jgi:hypothetical protein